MASSETRMFLQDLNIPHTCGLEDYRRRGGYTALAKCLREMKPHEVTEEVKNSGVRGRGGAGFPAGVKWGFVPKDTQKPKYLVCNADEGEPGTCKDRILMEYDPHCVIEGCLIAAYAVDAHYAFIYIRGEFWHIAEILEKAVKEAYTMGLAGRSILGTDFSCEVIVYRGAGAYICGEESGLLTSLEGKRGHPRNKPPFPAVEGLYGAPTVVNNVETLAALPYIIRNGADWYASMGTEKSKGTKLVCVSGHVQKPGVYEIELGKITLREIIDDLAGGVRDGHQIQAVIPGGSSMPILLADQLDIPYDYESVQQAGSMVGSGAIVVLDESVDMIEFALRLAEFYEHESCGQCTPCREGTQWLVHILRAIHEGRGHPDDIQTMRDLFETEMTSICLLWSAVVMPVRAILDKYESEFRERIAKGKPDFSPMGKPDKPVSLLKA